MTPLRRTPRTVISAVVAGLLAASVAGLAVSPAHADDRTVLKVVGTTDVSDSGLIQNVIEPDFEKANPTIDLQYTAQGTGAAIASAKTGSFSALLVHAASLENQFVADGYSAEPYGRSLFWGDYVLLGPKSDPAGVTSGGEPSHDAAGAFTKIAAAGAAGNAAFVSRGGTPGTTVQEHAIWALTSGVPTCTVSATQGGGEAPVTAANDGTTCSTTETSRPYPSWYAVTAQGQAGNIALANTCGAAVGGNGDDCYAFTDRGTYAYLQSQGQAQNLQIVARDNSATATGGADLLVNSFHGYAINPAKFEGGGQVNQAAATTFLDFLTSPSEQAKIGTYLGTGRQAGFIPSAAPLVTTGPLATSVTSGGTVSVDGNLTNATPGTPRLSGVTVQLYGSVSGGTPTLVGSSTTRDDGSFTVSATESQTTTYSLRTPQITKIEYPQLNPQFGDILQPTTTALGTVPVTLPSSSVSITKRTAGTGSRKNYLTIAGAVSPKVTGTGGRISVYRAHPGGSYSRASFSAIPAGATTYARTLYFPPGQWFYYVQYDNAGVVSSSRSTVYYFGSPR